MADIKHAAAFLPPEIAAARLTTAMALEIADESARCVVEAECDGGHVAGEQGRHMWWDTEKRLAHEDPEVRRLADDEMSRALQYLDLRSIIVRHADRPALVRFVEGAKV